MKSRKVFSLILLFLLIFNLAFISVNAEGEFKIPNPTSAFYCNDFADVLDSSTERRIVNLGEEIYERTDGGQIVFVSVQSIGDATIEEYANELFNKWGIGKGDKGVLFIISMSERISRIEVGYGFEGQLTDLQSNKLLKKFAEISSAEGIDAGVLNIYFDIASTVLGEAVASDDSSYDEGYSDYGYSGSIEIHPIYVILIVILIILDLILFRGRITFTILRMIATSKGGRRGGGGFGGGGFGGGGNRGGGGRSGGGGSSGRF